MGTTVAPSRSQHLAIWESVRPHSSGDSADEKIHRRCARTRVRNCLGRASREALGMIRFLFPAFLNCIQYGFFLNAVSMDPQFCCLAIHLSDNSRGRKYFKCAAPKLRILCKKKKRTGHSISWQSMSFVKRKLLNSREHRFVSPSVTIRPQSTTFVKTMLLLLQKEIIGTKMPQFL